MSSLVLLRQELMAFLQRHEIPALSAFPQERRKRYEQAFVLASVKEFSTEGAGFGHYLGEQYNKELQRWEARFGLAVSVCFALDIYSPRQRGEAEAGALLDRLAEAFSKDAPAALTPKELSWGERQYDESCDMFKAEGSARCQGILYTREDDEGSLISFEVRGGIILE